MIGERFDMDSNDFFNKLFKETQKSRFPENERTKKIFISTLNVPIEDRMTNERVPNEQNFKLKLHCVCCGKEFEPDESTVFMCGRGCGKSLLRLQKIIEMNCCSKECAVKTIQALYNAMCIGDEGRNDD